MPDVSARPHLVVLDACTLMSGVLRPALLDLAAAGRFLPLWTERIGHEWRRNAARIWPIEPDVLTREWDLMQARFPAADAGDTAAYEATLRYSDRKDFHVIAAGLAGRARAALPMVPRVTVLTWNLRDFNRGELRAQGMDVCDPDRLFVEWWRADPAGIQAVLERTLQDLAADGRARDGDLPDVLHRERLYRLAKLVRNATPVAAH